VPWLRYVLSSKTGRWSPVQFKRKKASDHGSCGGLSADGIWSTGLAAGREVDRPENFWGLEACPEDWIQILGMHSAELSRKLRPEPETIRTRARSSCAFLKIVREKTSSQLTDQDLRTMLAEMVQPLHAEVADAQGTAGAGAPNAASLKYR